MHVAAAASEGDRGVPSPTLDAIQREAVCAVARKAAAAVDDVGAGTIEFVSNGKEVFFIEMNTRLQVEHPVTELITGIDLVEWQLRVAFGERLPLTQDQIVLNGHAIKHPDLCGKSAQEFHAFGGSIVPGDTPEPSNGLRVDAGYRQGDAVSPHYDAMLAKVIAWAPTRPPRSSGSIAGSRNPTFGASSPTFHSCRRWSPTRTCAPMRSIPVSSNAN